MAEWFFLSDPQRAIEICKLISIQRRVTETARRVHTLIGDPDGLERRYSSSAFLSILDSVISSKEQSEYNISIADAHSYIFNSVHDLLEYGDAIKVFIDQKYINEYRSLLSDTHLSNIYYRNKEPDEYIASTQKCANRVSGIKTALPNVDDPNFVGYIESGIKGLGDLHEIATELIKHNSALLEKKSALLEKSKTALRWQIGIIISAFSIVSAVIIKMLWGK